MRISVLWDRYKGKEVWIIGSGPSMRFMPKEIFRDKITIGLNQAWKYGIPLTFSLTVHPELIVGGLDVEAPYASAKNPPSTQWIVKKKPPMETLELDDPRYYVFLTEQNNYDLVRKRKPDTLFLGHGIQCTAISLAAHMGASAIFLVGVDMTDIGGVHHGHAQYVQFHGLAPKDVYREYRDDAAAVRRIVRDELKIPVVTVSPFLGLAHPDEDFKRLHAELKLSTLPAPKDVSRYMRKKDK